VSSEALVLALSAVIRPTTAAAVLAMLATRHPQRLLAAYIAAGLAFSLAVGTLVVVLLQGVGGARSAAVRPYVDVILGVLALGYAIAVGLGWEPRRRSAGASTAPSWVQGRLQDLSPRGAAATGVITHLPGLIYLAALNAIVASARDPADGVLQVVVYNAIWFSTAFVALLLSLFRPNMPEEILAELGSWARRHRRAIVVVIFGALGVYLVVSGVLDLLGSPWTTLRMPGGTRLR